MASLILEEKLESLRPCIHRIEQRRAESAEQLAADVHRQDILSLNLTRAVQLCVDMAMHFLTYADLPPPANLTVGRMQRSDIRRP